MDVAPVTVKYYQTSSGRCPFRDWLNSLDGKIGARVDARLARVRRGLFGDSEPVGGGVLELKFDIGPGYRIYFGRVGKDVVILLYSGDKKGQAEDIKSAQSFWNDYLRRIKQ